MKSKFNINYRKDIRKPANYRTILQVANSKTSKGEKKGVMTAICYFAPANEAGRGNLCAGKSTGCELGCLFEAGRGRFDNVRNARIAKTHFFFDYRETFIASLRYDIARLARRAAKLKMRFCVRINGTSDLPWLAMQLSEEFPEVQFYDYTKLPKSWLRIRPNYHITFSHSEINHSECIAALAHNMNVAVVFEKELPETFLGVKVINGDTTDLRYLEGYQGVVVGLKAKGPAKKDTSGFVVRPQLVQIQVAA